MCSGVTASHFVVVMGLPELERATVASREGKEAVTLGDGKRCLLIGTRKASK